MKLFVKEQVEVTKEIEVQFPIYYEHNMYSDYGESIIYGKITEKLHTCIHLQMNNGAPSAEIQIMTVDYTRNSQNNPDFSGYLTGKHSSNASVYNKAKRSLIQLVREL